MIFIFASFSEVLGSRAGDSKTIMGGATEDDGSGVASRTVGAQGLSLTCESSGKASNFSTCAS